MSLALHQMLHLTQDLTCITLCENRVRTTSVSYDKVASKHCK